MYIYYDSLTGNVENFVKKILEIYDFEIIKITPETKVLKPSHFITYTTGFGNVSETTKKFLMFNKNYLNIKSVCVSGNKNWGPNFGKAGDVISKKFNIDLVMKFELSGTKEDVFKYVEIILEKEGVKK